MEAPPFGIDDFAFPIRLYRKAPSAFTLLEILVASAIMGIVIFVLVSTANTSMRLWRGTSEKMAVDREGRSGMALLAWDLQNILQPTNLAIRPWINTNIITNGSGSFPMLRFLTLKPIDYQTGTNDQGDICYVEYRLTNHTLERAFVSSSLTFAAITNSPPRFPTPSASDFEVLVPNVWRFKIWGLQAGNSHVGYSPSTGQQILPADILRSVEYRIGVLDQKYMRLHRESPASLPANLRDSSLRWYQAIQHISAPIP